MSLPKHSEIVVIGGGVMGASTAYHLAQRGMHDVALLEKEPFFGTGATGRCAGGVRYQFSTEVNIRLSQASLPMLDRFEEEMGQAIDRRHCGYFFLLTREADVAQFRQNVALQHRLGVPTQWLTGDEVRQRLPLFNAHDVIAATVCPEDGLADPNGVVAGYVAGARRLGVQLWADTAVQAITHHAAAYTVHTNQGDIQCSKIVNAAGPWAGQISDMLGVPLPIVPLRRQWLTTTPLPALPPDFPFVIFFAQSLYFHPEGKGLLTGMSNPSEPPGFGQAVDEAWELVHLEAAIERLPLLERAGRQSGLAGLYEVTPDAHPIISNVPEVDGYFVVAGFSGHGFMHGPIAGKLMAEIMLDGAAHTVDVSMLDYGRFADGRLIQEYNVV